MHIKFCKCNFLVVLKGLEVEKRLFIAACQHKIRYKQKRFYSSWNLKRKSLDTEAKALLAWKYHDARIYRVYKKTACKEYVKEKSDVMENDRL